MVNFDKVKEEFIKYTNNYNLEDKNISRKVGHSLRVMNISKQIAEKLNLEQEQIEIATLIGLLHDIGRFEQRTKFKTFEDIQSIDHGDLAVEILKENSYLRNYIQEDKYDEIILKAIKNHNKYKIEEGLTSEELLFSKIIRDADKTDILYESAELFWKENEEKVNKELSDEEVMNFFMNKKLINRDKMKNKSNYINQIIAVIAFIFDINFKETFEIINENKYIDRIFNRFVFEDIETKQKMEDARNLANTYIETKIRNGEK